MCSSLVAQGATKTRALEGTPSFAYLNGSSLEQRESLFVLLERRDFRLNFATPAILATRTKASIAVFDRMGQSREVPIVEGETVRSFLKKAGVTLPKEASWQPQIRLVAEDSIVQSPARFDRDAAEAFFNLTIKPADVLVVTFVQ